MAAGSQPPSLGSSSDPVNFDERVLGTIQLKVIRQLSESGWLSRYYLAGGTAVALHLGHRRSADLDWFTGEPMGDALVLARSLQQARLRFRTAAVAPGTLHGRLSGVRVTCLEYRYPLLHAAPVWNSTGCHVASLDDLACMKLSAVAQRGSKRDFIDVYALALRHAPLADLVDLYRKKYSTGDVGHVLYGLTYFDDADQERMPRMLWDVDWRTVKVMLREWVRATAQ